MPMPLPMPMPMPAAAASDVDVDREAPSPSLYRGPSDAAAPQSPLDFVMALAPVLKYYAVLLFLYYVARRLNRAVDREAELQDRERQRPELSRELMAESSDDDDDDEEDESSEEEEIYEELVTDGSRLVSVPEGERTGGAAASSRGGSSSKASSSGLRARRKSKKADKGDPSATTSKQKVSGRAHPLFEGLKKVEEELRQRKDNEGQDGDGNVSWNELHMAMLRRYKDKFPEHGPRVAGADDGYDDEFKELLQKHNINAEAFKKTE